ncbi:MAG TPA: tetratricopeptide repeat protein [Pyrinomonadaceae bacterium]|nr:tetratricopeptide repeat protein [Pyrinomonadaceae bacterium]
MKRCPTCDQTYPDETLQFCRVDGALLVSDSPEAEVTRVLPESRATGEAPTEVLRNTGEGRLTTSALKPGPPSAAIGAPRRSKRRRKLALITSLIVLIAVVLAGYISYRHARDTEVAIDSIAVLPFENQSHDVDSDYLSDGVTESIINNLTQLPNLKVIARSSVFRYKGKETDPFAVGKELGVRAVLTGRIIQRGDNLSISTELVDVRDNRQLWGEQYERKVSDLMSLQRDIAGQIANNLRLKISGEEHNRMMKHYTDNPEAYQLYLKGRYFWNKRTSDGLNRSIDYFNQAITKDQAYALAYAGLADAYVVLPSYSRTPSKEAYLKARAAATQALALDDNVAEAHTSLAMVRFWYDWGAGAEPEFKRAIELNPNYATGHHWYSLYLSAMGRHDEAIAEMKRAQELDPFSIVINAELGLPYLYARQYDQAIIRFQKAIEMDPSFAFAHFALGEAYDRKGRYEEAIAEHEKALALAGGDAPQVWSAMTGQLEGANQTLGEKGYWQKRLELTKKLYEQHAATAEAVAEMYAIVGDKEQAFAWLEKSYQQHEDFLVFLKIQPEFDALHSDPRYADLLRRVGLTP